MDNLTEYEQWQDASDTWAAARRAMLDAQAALKAAEQAYYAAEEQLAKHEIRPGIPKYKAMQA